MATMDQTAEHSVRYLVLLDRDGTLIEEKNYLCDPEQVVLLPHVVEALQLLREKEFALAVVTNQAGIGRGYYDEAAMHRVNDRLMELLAEKGIRLDGVYFCPHAPDAGCACRKPEPGMARQAAVNLGCFLEQAYVVGDKICDVELARRCGAKGILVRTGYGRKAEGAAEGRAHHVADTLLDAARWIIADVKENTGK